MPPIFKNVEVTFYDVNKKVKKQIKSNYKNRKLIGSHLGKKCCFYSIIKLVFGKGFDNK